MPTVSKGAMRMYKIRTARLLRAVPTLDLRRKQLNREIIVWEIGIKESALKYASLAKRMSENPHAEVEKIVVVDGLEFDRINVAGVMLEEVSEVRFHPVIYNLFSTMPSIDEFILIRKELLEVDAKLNAKRKALEILSGELAVTTQRINLFEKRLIPEYQENIRYIRGRLEDNERASVMVAKIAQAQMLEEQFATETA